MSLKMKQKYDKQGVFETGWYLSPTRRDAHMVIKFSIFLLILRFRDTQKSMTDGKKMFLLGYVIKLNSAPHRTKPLDPVYTVPDSRIVTTSISASLRSYLLSQFFL